MTDVVSEHIVVSADPDTVMDVIGDYESYPEWQPEVRSVEILQTDEHGRGTRVRYEVDAKVFRATYVLHYDYTPTSISWRLESSEQLRALNGAYEVTDRGDGSTEVGYRLEVVPAVPMPSIMRRRAARRIVDAALRGLEARAESNA